MRNTTRNMDHVMIGAKPGKRGHERITTAFFAPAEGFYMSENKARIIRIFKYIPPAAAALLVLAVSIVLWYFPNYYPAHLYQWGDGDYQTAGVAWDITGYDLDSYNIHIAGKIEYVIGKHLSPEEFDSYEGEIHYGRVPSDVRVATARITLLFPDDRTYALSTLSLAFSERFYVNGEPRLLIGSPGLTAEETKSSRARVVFEVQPVGGIVTIVRQGANFGHRQGEDYAEYWIGSPANIRQMVAVSQLSNAVSVGLYLCLFLLHMVLFLLIRGYRANLWFALLCALWMFRVGGEGRFLIWPTIFPGFSWSAAYMFGCISLALTGILILLLVYDQFPGIMRKWHLLVAILVQAVWIPVYIIVGTPTTSQLKIASEVLLGLTAVCIMLRLVWIFIRHRKKNKPLPEQYLTMIGLAVVLFAVIHDALFYNNLWWYFRPFLRSYAISGISIIVLVLLQAGATILGSMRQLNEARRAAMIAWESANVARQEQRLAELRAERAQNDLEIQKQLAAIIPKGSLIVFPPFTLNTANRQAYNSGEDLRLKPIEFDLLAYFIAHDNEVVTKEEIYQAVWKQPFVPSDNALKGCLQRLRGKIDGCGYVITNVRGKGFYFEKE